MNALPVRLLSKSKPDCILARIMLTTLVILTVAYVIFGIVQKFTTDQGKLYKGKLIMLGSILLSGTIISFIMPHGFALFYPQIKPFIQ